MKKRILVIGDIHGMWDRFMSLYEQIDYNPDEDMLIFLGDYIDRGDKPLHVLDWMYEHRKDSNIVMLRGNHEQMMLDFYESGECGELWLWNGGDRTRRGLKKQSDDVRKNCFAFVASLPLSHQMTIGDKHYFFCHAGINPSLPLDRQTETALLWAREDYYDHYSGKDIIVSGHTNVDWIRPGTTKPIVWENMIFLDTGSYLPKGHISCVDILSGKIWQSMDETEQMKEG